MSEATSTALEAELGATHLSRRQLSSLAIASYIPAVGVATFPFLLFGAAGNGSWLAALLGFIGCIAIGQAIIVFCKRYVVTGSLYSYIAHVFGPWSRTITAVCLFLGFICQVACNTFLIGIYGGSFLVSIGVGGGLDSGLQIALYAGAILIAAAVAYRGLDISVTVALALTAISLPIVLFITIFSGIHTGLDLGPQLSMEGSTLAGVFTGLAAGAAYVVAFESCASLAAETREPKRNVPWAVMSVPIVLGVLYLFSTFLQVPGLTASSELLDAGLSAPAALAQNAGLGTVIGQICDLVLSIAGFASLIGFMNYGSRFIATIASDGLLPKRIAHVHPRFHTPSTSIVTLSVLGLGTMVVLLIVTQQGIFTVYTALATLLVFYWVIPYLLIAAGAVVLMRRLKSLTIGLVISSVVGAAMFAWLYVNSLVYPPPAPINAMSWLFVVTIVVGFVAFWVIERRRRDTVGSPDAELTAELTAEPTA